MVRIFLISVAVVAIGVLLTLALEAARQRARARRVRKALGETTDLEEGQPRTLSGTLVAPGVEPGEPVVTTVLPSSVANAELATVGAQTSHRPHLVLATASGDRIALEGPLQVLCGAVEGRREQLGLEEAGSFDDAVRLLRQGDEVVAQGRLVRIAEENAERVYRQDASGYALHPPEDPEWQGHPVTLAYARVPQGPRRAGWALASAVTLGALAALELRPQPPPILATVANAPRPCVASLRRDLDRDASAVVAKLDTCPDPLLAAETYWSVADFKHAATSYLEARDADPDLAPTVSEVEALAIAGYHHSAAEVVRFMARTWYTAPKSAERDRLVCIADALDARSGPAAADALEAFAERQQSDATPAECAYLYADLESDEEERLHRLQGGYAFADTDLRQLLIAEVTNDDYAFPHITEGYPLSAMTDPQPWIHLRPIALEMAILGRIDDIRLTHERREALAGYAAEVALFHAFMGEREKALDALAPMERFVGDAERRPFVLGAIAALHVGDVYRAEQLMDWGREDSHAIAKLRQVVKTMQREREVDFAHEIDTEPWSPNVDLFTAGKTGDGAKVALALRDFNTMGRQALPRIVPHLTRGHAALREWANDAFPGPCRSCGLSALAEHAGARREAARVIQDDTLYARMSERTQRILEGMLRRDLALVFLLLERFAEG